MRVVLLTAEEGFVFSFLKSEKFGTDWARGLSLRLPPDERETDTAVVRGVPEGICLLGKIFLLCLEAP